MSPRILNVESFLQQASELPVFDVRSPAEYKKGHLPGALNLPLFSDEERHEIGLLYKNSGKDPAVLRGLEIVGPRLTDYIAQARRLTAADSVLLHCWRGGLRSESMAWLLEKAGFRIGLLKGGYKNYRKHLSAVFAHPWQLLVLSGMTGSGKTEILQILRKRGEQVLDLEGLARHRGSAFGAFVDTEQPSTEQFENDSAAALASFDRNKPVWVEDESRRIGWVTIPEALFNQMRHARVIRIHVSREVRVERLCREYGQVPKNILDAATANIGKRLGGEKTGRVLQAIANGDYSLAANAILEYYDKTYQYGLSRRNPATIVELNPTPLDPHAIAGELIKISEEV